MPNPIIHYNKISDACKTKLRYVEKNAISKTETSVKKKICLCLFAYCILKHPLYRQMASDITQPHCISFSRMSI
jgi:hypothetical protein